MTDEERDRVLMEINFYHVTLWANLTSIKEGGLSPAFSDCDKYRRWLRRPTVFLSTEGALPIAKKMFENGIAHTPRVVLKIPATAVAQCECDVDRSFADCTTGLTLIECMEQVGFLACYGTIPPNLLEVAEYQDGQGNWRAGE